MRPLYISHGSLCTRFHLLLQLRQRASSILFSIFALKT
jgi:hypothetical protein